MTATGLGLCRCFLSASGHSHRVDNVTHHNPNHVAAANEPATPKLRFNVNIRWRTNVLSFPLFFSCRTWRLAPFLIVENFFNSVISQQASPALQSLIGQNGEHRGGKRISFRISLLVHLLLFLIFPLRPTSGHQKVAPESTSYRPTLQPTVFRRSPMR